MPAVLIFIFLVTEFLISGWFASGFGVGTLFLEIITTGVIGIVLISSMNYHLNDALNSVRKGELHPNEMLTSSVSRVIGAILILIPGVFTDIIGLILLLNSKVRGRYNNSTTNGFEKKDENVYRKEDNEIIDVEIVEEDGNGKTNNSN